MSGYWKLKTGNCYWCKCSYCVNYVRLETCMLYCVKCRANKNFKMPVNCDDFIEEQKDTKKLVNEIFDLKLQLQRCENCDYKRKLKIIKLYVK